MTVTIYGYVRVSTLRQANEGESLDVQRRQIEGYALMHDLGTVEYHVEEGISGSVPVNDRPVGGKLFESVVVGDVIIAAKLDRLFRSALDALTVVEDLRSRGVRLHLLDLGGDIAGNGLSKLFLTIAAAFAEAERDRIRERVTQVKRDQKARGRYLGGALPFGYLIGPEGELTTDAQAQDVIERIFEMKNSGLSLRAISAALASGGVKLSHQGVSNVLRQHGAGSEERTTCVAARVAARSVNIETDSRFGMF